MEREIVRLLNLEGKVLELKIIDKINGLNSSRLDALKNKRANCYSTKETYIFKATYEDRDRYFLLDRERDEDNVELKVFSDIISLNEEIVYRKEICMDLDSELYMFNILAKEYMELHSIDIDIEVEIMELQEDYKFKIKIADETVAEESSIYKLDMNQLFEKITTKDEKEAV